MKRILGIFLCLFLFFGCVEEEEPVVIPSPIINVTNVTNVTVTNVTNVTAPCENISAVPERDLCFKALAVEGGNVSVCERIYSVDVRDDCILFFSNESVLLCDKLTDEDKKDDCFGVHARKEDDSLLCDRISDDGKRESCRRAVLSPCVFEEDEEKRRLCFALEGEDYSICEGVDSCLLSYAVNKSDGEACSQISLNARRGACLSMVFGNDSCSPLALRGERDFCYEIIGEETNNIFFCNKATDGTVYENNCYTFLAVKNMDSAICKHCSSDIDEDICYKNYSLSTGDWSVCSDIRGSGTADMCHRETAKLYALPSACSGISSTYGRNACYGVVLASGKKIDSTECEGIPTETWRDKCYSTVAVQTNNKGLCDLIVSDATRETCKSKFVE